MNRQIIIMMMLEVVDWGREYNDGYRIVIRWLISYMYVSMGFYDCVGYYG